MKFLKKSRFCLKTNYKRLCFTNLLGREQGKISLLICIPARLQTIFKEELKADLKQITQKLSRQTKLKHKFFSNLYTELTY